MALDKDILGQAMYNAFNDFNNKDINTLGNIEDVRLSFCKTMANVIITHFKTNAVITPDAMLAPEHAGLVTGTGKIN